MRLGLSASTVSEIRFAFSPLFELDALLRVSLLRPDTLITRDHKARMTSFSTRAAGDPARVALLDLARGQSGLTMLSPTTTALDDDLTLAFSSIRETPHGKLIAQLEELPEDVHLPERTVKFFADPASPERLGDALEVAWQELMAPIWPRTRAALQRDLLLRSASLVSLGWKGAVAQLHEGISISGSYLVIAENVKSPALTVSSERVSGVQFMPSVYLDGAVAIHVSDSDVYSLSYPAWGARYLHDAHATAGSSLARLIGETRLDVLWQLQAPATTTMIAQILDKPVGTIGDHISVLRQTGLASRARDGKSVVYMLTPLGGALLAGSDGL